LLDNIKKQNVDKVFVAIDKGSDSWFTDKKHLINLCTFVNQLGPACKGLFCSFPITLQVIDRSKQTFLVFRSWFSNLCARLEETVGKGITYNLWAADDTSRDVTICFNIEKTDSKLEKTTLLNRIRFDITSGAIPFTNLSGEYNGVFKHNTELEKIQFGHNYYKVLKNSIDT
jgi:hypothetical protein